VRADDNEVGLEVSGNLNDFLRRGIAGMHQPEHLHMRVEMLLLTHQVQLPLRPDDHLIEIFGQNQIGPARIGDGLEDMEQDYLRPKRIGQRHRVPERFPGFVRKIGWDENRIEPNDRSGRTGFTRSFRTSRPHSKGRCFSHVHQPRRFHAFEGLQGADAGFGAGAGTGALEGCIRDSGVNGFGVAPVSAAGLCSIDGGGVAVEVRV
jgi:hypothetical protein